MGTRDVGKTSDSIGQRGCKLRKNSREILEKLGVDTSGITGLL